MTKAQWKAVYDTCEEFDCTTHELLTVLKENGTLGRGESLTNLADRVDKKDYDTMLNFLGENI